MEQNKKLFEKTTKKKKQNLQKPQTHIRMYV